MEAKLFELRDKATFIVLLAVKLDPTCDKDRYLLSRAGYGRTDVDQSEYILLMNASSGNGEFNCEFYDRTYAQAQLYLRHMWSTLKSGDLLDIEFILGETEVPKISEGDEPMYRNGVRQ